MGAATASEPFETPTEKYPSEDVCTRDAPTTKENETPTEGIVANVYAVLKTDSFSLTPIGRHELVWNRIAAENDKRKESIFGAEASTKLLSVCRILSYI